MATTEAGARTPSKSRLLVATPRLDDPNFRRAVVLVVEHNDEGSIGVVLNRPSPLAVADVLPGWGERVGSDVHLLVGGRIELGQFGSRPGRMTLRRRGHYQAMQMLE